MSAQPPAARVPDLHKSAFWIYGVTAMVMREPLSIVLHHASTAGWANPDVLMEALRGLIVWLLLSRQFTVAGVYFDRVYLQPDSGVQFANRNFPVDFILGIGALLLAVGASTIVGVKGSLFDGVVGLALQWDLLWLLVARLMGHSAVRLIAPGALFNLGILVVFWGVRSVFGDGLGYGALLVSSVVQMWRLMVNYDSLYANPGSKS